MADHRDNIDKVRARIAHAARQHGRDPSTVMLLAVSKTQPAEQVRTALARGQRAFGENYVQELVAKARALSSESVEWHFIGPIQSNKTRAVAEICHWVHSVDREKTAVRLSEQRPADMPPLQVCLQVNVSGEASKSGIDPADLPALAERVSALPNLTLRGLMAIPAAATDTHLQRQAFSRLRALLEMLRDRGLALDTLSMGMSNDLEAAIAEGATIVRVGTALFGPRIPRGQA